MTEGYIIYSQSVTIPLNSTRYVDPFGIHTIQTAENIPRTPICQNTAKKLWMKCFSNSNADLGLAVMVRKNGADTALYGWVPANETGVFSATADVDFADGDEISIKFTNADPDGAVNLVVGICFLSQ